LKADQKEVSAFPTVENALEKSGRTTTHSFIAGYGWDIYEKNVE